ncbi:MAG TPA: hypothetical protein VIT91_17590 [Chthoniobacterales bacterium]
MTATRKLLYFPFWLSVVLAVPGFVITFVPGADRGWFLTVAALSATGLFIPKTLYRVAAALLLLLALSQAYTGHRRGIEYRQRLSTDRPVSP